MQLSRLTLALFPLLVGGCDFFASTETRLSRAEAQMAAADYRRATIELKNVLQQQPANGRAWRLLAESSLQLGDAQSAERELGRALASGTAADAVGELTARIHLSLGRFANLLEAIESGEIVLAEPSQSLYRSRALQGLQRYPEAAAMLSGLLANYPGLSEARVTLAEVHAGQGDFDLALAELNRVITEDPGSAQAWLIRGALLARRGQFEEARRSLQTAREQAQGKLTVQQQMVLLGALVEAHLSLGAIKEAEQSHRELAGMSSAAPLTRFLGARIAIVQQDFSGAAADLQRLVSTIPNFIAARFLLGAVLLAQNNLQQAHLQLSQVVQDAPDNLEARKLLARVNLRLNHPDEAMQVLAPALESNTNDSQVNALFGTARMQAGDEAGAIDFLERTLARNPDDQPMRLDLAAAYLRSGDNQKALAMLRGTKGGGNRLAGLTIAALLATEGATSAYAEAERLLEQSPEDIDLLNLAGDLYVRQGEFDRARGLLTRALAASSANVGTMFKAAELELTAGNLDVSLGWLERILAADPAHAAARLGLAELAFRRGDAAEAARQLEEVRRRDPRAIEARLRLFRLHLLANRNKEAQEVLAEAIANAPNPGRVQNSAGLILLDAGRYDEAIGRFRAAVDTDSGQATYWLNLSRAQLALNQTDVARESVNRALTLQPDWIPAAGAAALMDVRAGNNAAATSRIRSLRQKRPSDPEVLVLQGDINLAMKNYEAAATAFASASALRPEATTALKSYRARYLGHLGKVTEPLSEWLALAPADVTVRSVLAEAYQLTDQRAKAIAEYEIVVASGPANPAALNNLAWLYYKAGDKRALDTAFKAHSLAPGVPVVTDTYGWILVESGRVAEGLKLLEEAKKALPGNADVAYHHAAALARVGEKESAVLQVQRVLQQHSAFESRADAQKLLADLQAR